jgi:hypothetical protein
MVVNILFHKSLGYIIHNMNERGETSIPHLLLSYGIRFLVLFFGLSIGIFYRFMLY